MSARFIATIERLMALIYVPEPNCSCHISAPCSDCVEFRATREEIADARAVIQDQPDTADTRLRDAALDMFEALALLVSLPVRYVDNRIEIDTGSHSEAMEIVRKARAAIAKAVTP